jgi:hypothetical protein
MSETASGRRALVIYESMFGNSEKVAGAVAEGLRSRDYDAVAVDVRWATPAAALDVDLLVVGAPTHAFSLSRPSTRADAVRQGAPASHAATGLREWLATIEPKPHDRPLVAVYDTRASKVRRLPTAAARTAAKLLRRRGFHVLGRGEGFLVEDVRGPLCPGELAHAVAWGHELADAAS